MNINIYFLLSNLNILSRNGFKRELQGVTIKTTKDSRSIGYSMFKKALSITIADGNQLEMWEKLINKSCKNADVERYSCDTFTVVFLLSINIM